MDSRDVAPSLPQSNPDADAVPDLLRRAVSGVLRNAQNGDLPLFAWTLGMPQSELLALLARMFPEVDPVEAMPDAQYQQLLRMCWPCCWPTATRPSPNAPPAGWHTPLPPPAMASANCGKTWN